MWIKVCGLTSVKNALQVCDAGVDAIGLNFYAKSKRCVDIKTARRIVESLPANVEPIGLFVNHTLDEIRTVTRETGIKTIQLHGDETAEFATQLRDLKIIRAIRIDETNIKQLSSEIGSFRTAGVALAGCLIDANVQGSYGGTGHTAPWEMIASHYDAENWPPLILAGGLNPKNIEAAIRMVQPWGVDTASGVESAPGMKDPTQVSEFVSGATKEND
ncbi:phosphoribosylanthranilate isomerase [Thalassoglobus sp.]|uniref:phosphoribosylanthranilate isomerase n=1 Tax=Thalassoglobus sp. TaxID=2795869 RepID=UPI003AA849FE